MSSTISPLLSLDASKLTISLNDEPFPIPSATEASTKNHTDHLLRATWTSTSGWSAPEIVPYAPLSLSPTASVLHYATSCFEGTKLYRGFDGKLRTFRLLDNCRRMGESATRMCMGAPDPEELAKLVKQLCEVDGSRWLPSETSRGRFLYIRPTMIGVDADLALQVSKEVLLYVLLTTWPVSVSPPPDAKVAGFKLWASPDTSVRAWPGGAGNHKISANYGLALQAHAEARKEGFDQVLWLYGAENFVTEAGGSNFFVLWKTEMGRVELITAPLDSGLILPGITRRSILALAKTRFGTASEWDLGGSIIHVPAVDVVEKDFTMVNLVEASEEKRLLGAFAAGTANFVVPVTEIYYREGSIHIHADAVPHTALLRKWLSDIMYGLEESEWTEIIDG